MTYGLRDHMKGYNEKEFTCSECGREFVVVKANWQHWPPKLYCSYQCKDLGELRELLMRERNEQGGKDRWLSKLIMHYKQLYQGIFTRMGFYN